MHKPEAILEANDKTAIQMIKDNLATSDKWVLRAVLVIFEGQTAAEQDTESTREHNGIGFNSADAEILSSFAKQIIDHEAGKSKFRSPLSPRQMAMARKKISKYAKQLLRVSRAKAAAAAAKLVPEAELVTID